MTRKKRIREENLSAASSEQLGCSGPSMNAFVNSRPGGANASNDCAESSSTRGIDALSVGQSNIGQAFYQRRRKTKGISSAYVDVGDMINVCVDCHALFWLQESKFIPRNGSPVYTGCCQEGRIRLPPVRPAPVVLEYLLDSTNGQKSVQFRNNIRSYNTMFAFTSMGANVDKTVTDGHGPYVFKISGQVYHLMGSLIPLEGECPKFAQLYIYDTENEVANRQKAVDGLDSEIVTR